MTRYWKENKSNLFLKWHKSLASCYSVVSENKKTCLSVLGFCLKSKMACTIDFRTVYSFYISNIIELLRPSWNRGNSITMHDVAWVELLSWQDLSEHFDIPCRKIQRRLEDVVNPHEISVYNFSGHSKEV
jgi:hypothetical protein